MAESTKTEKMRQIKDEVVALEESPLYAYRKENNYYPVIGEGDHDAKVMFVGEGPGKNEAETGRPFCGAAGRVLTELIESIGLTREEVYITNIIKDRPPGNRDPEPQEIELYAPFLDRQIDIIEPQVVATLGRFSMDYLLNRFGAAQAGETISTLHGSVIETGLAPAPSEDGTGGASGDKKVTLMPLYHPAVALYKASMREVLEADFKKLKRLIG